MKPIRVLVACEFSGIVRDAFIESGYDAMSCDIVPTESPGPHYIGDVRDVLDNDWDLMVAHPPCRYLCCAGARWWSTRQTEQLEALAFVQELLNAPVQHIAIENPPGKIGSTIEPATQYIQPWQYGHGETKKTGLWLRNLPPLTPTNIVSGRIARVHRMAPPPKSDPDRRRRERSRFYTGIASAMADQWGRYVTMFSNRLENT
jgi:hypothetical protein